MLDGVEKAGVGDGHDDRPRPGLGPDDVLEG